METKSLALAVLTAFFLTMPNEAQPATSPITANSLAWKSQQGGDLKYLLYLPKGYAEKKEERWPLMFFLHGSGERGSDVRRVAVHGPLKLVGQGTNFPFIIVAPQCPDNQLWEPEPLLQLLDLVTAKHAVDTNRVCLTGLSMGGYGTWSLGLRRPEKFAALAPICGGGNLIEMVLAGPKHEAALRSLPVWAFHGAKDPVVPPAESERMVNALKKARHSNVRLTVYPEAQHDSWTQTYDDPKFYEWLLAQRRK